MDNKTVHMVTFTLLVIGGLNWLLVGLLNFDLVMWIFVDLLGIGLLAKVVYILVGLSALYELVMHKKTCGVCSTGAVEAPAPSGDMTHG
jgi:uncharacterized protein